MKAGREKEQKELHMVFIDLEKAYMTGYHGRKFGGV